MLLGIRDAWLSLQLPERLILGCWVIPESRTLKKGSYDLNKVEFIGSLPSHFVKLFSVERVGF